MPEQGEPQQQQQQQQQQRALWDLLCWNYPADIIRTLENTEHVRSDVVHHLYGILQEARGEPAPYLISRLASLPDATAKAAVDALDALNIRSPGPNSESASGRGLGGPEGKPYFHSPERECFWRIVLELFETGYLGENADGSAREQILDFHVLHCLYRLDIEDKRSRRNEEVNLRNPAHPWYHETTDRQVLWCVKRMWPFVDGKLNGVVDQRDVGTRSE